MAGGPSFWRGKHSSWRGGLFGRKERSGLVVPPALFATPCFPAPDHRALDPPPPKALALCANHGATRRNRGRLPRAIGTESHAPVRSTGGFMRESRRSPPTAATPNPPARPLNATHPRTPLNCSVAPCFGQSAHVFRMNTNATPCAGLVPSSTSPRAARELAQGRQKKPRKWPQSAISMCGFPSQLQIRPQLGCVGSLIGRGVSQLRPDTGLVGP